MISTRGLTLVGRAVETGETSEQVLLKYVGALECAVSALMLGGSTRIAQALTHLRDVEQDCDSHLASTSVYSGEEGG